MGSYELAGWLADQVERGLLGGGGGFVSATSKGAKGDGVTDDAPALNAALAALGSTGGALVLPPAIYLVQSPVVVPGGVKLIGCGVDYFSPGAGFGGTPTLNSIIRAGASIGSSNPTVQFGTTQYPAAGWNNDGQTGASAEWLVVDANSNAASAVQTFGTRCRLDHIEARNGLTATMDLSGQNTECIGCIADGNNTGVTVQVNNNDVKWKDGEIRNGSTAHLLITASTGNTMIDGPDIYGGAVCPCILANITASTTLGRIVNCNLNPTTSNGIQLTVAAAQTLWGVMIANNKMYGPTAGLGGGFGCRVDVTAAGSAIDGLVFNGNLLTDKSNGQRSGNGWSGFIARASSSGTVRNSVVVGNYGNGMSALFGGAFVPTVQHANVWINNSGTAFQSSQEGTATFSGTGAQTTFSVNHNIGSAPSWFDAVATSAAAVGASVSASSTQLTFTFAAAPASGSNNVTFNWAAKA